MQSSLIGKIQKAHLYAQEPDRVEITSLSARFRGDHDTYTVTFENEWECTCEFFAEWKTCSHIMATQRLMGPVSPGEPAGLAAESATA
jgi:hypothetical protein